jgi:hypothetical protein
LLVAESIFAAAENAERLLGMSFDGLLISGTWRVPTMSVRNGRLFRRVVGIHDRVPVVLCSAHSDPRIAFDLTRLAASRRSDGRAPRLRGRRHIVGFSSSWRPPRRGS